jgi:hypothetical protein
VEKKKAEGLRQRALDLVAVITTRYFELASVLFEIKNSTTPIANGELPLYEFFGYDNWFEYVEHDLGMHWGRASRLVRMHEVFIIECAEVDFDMAAVRALGITKLLDLTYVVTPKNIRGWIKRATGASCCEVREAVRAAREGRIARKDRATLHVEVDRKTLDVVNEIVEIMRADTAMFNRGDIIGASLAQYLTALKAKGRLRKVG